MTSYVVAAFYFVRVNLKTSIAKPSVAVAVAVAAAAPPLLLLLLLLLLLR